MSYSDVGNCIGSWCPFKTGPGWLYKPITNTAWVHAQLCKLQKNSLDSQPQVVVYQLLAHGRWFSPGTPAFSTTKAGLHDIAESGIKHQKSTQKIILRLVTYGLVR